MSGIISGLVEAMTAPIRAATDAALQMLKPAEPAPKQRRSKGWRKHMRKMKAAQRRG